MAGDKDLNLINGLCRRLAQVRLPPGQRNPLIETLAALSQGQQQAVVRHLTGAGVAVWVAGHGLQWAAAAQQQLADAAAREVHRTMAAQRQMWSVVAAIEAQLGPVVLVFKGWAVEQLAYAAPLVRPCTDVDLVIAPGQMGAVAEVLRQLGMQLHHTRSGAAHWLGVDTAVDVHDAPIDPRRCPAFADAGAITALFARAVRKQGVPVLADADQAALLLLHATTGLGSDLRHLADLAHVWHAAGVADGDVVARLQCWRAMTPAHIVVLAVLRHCREDPPAQLLAFAALLGAPKLRLATARAAQGVARRNRPPAAPNPWWGEAVLLAAAWPDAKWTALSRGMINRIRGGGQRW